MGKLARIYQLETTNYCSANCDYCPHRKMTRAKGYVSMDTVQKVAKHCENVGQKYIALHHMGEPLLHAQIGDIITTFRAYGVKTEFSTNGKLLAKKGLQVLTAGVGLIRIAVDYFYNTPGYIEEIKQFLINAKPYPNTKIHLHTIVNNALDPFKEFESEQVQLEVKALDNWAGEVEGESQLDPSNQCYFQDYNYVVVLWDGRISTCCLDYDGKHTLGKIDHIMDITNRPFPICKNCNKLQFASDGGWEI